MKQLIALIISAVVVLSVSSVFASSVIVIDCPPEGCSLPIPATADHVNIASLGGQSFCTVNSNQRPLRGMPVGEVTISLDVDQYSEGIHCQPAAPGITTQIRYVWKDPLGWIP